MASTRAMTAQELLQYSHEPYRTELIAGRLVEMEPAGALHGSAAARICRLLVEHVVTRGLGEVFGAETGYVLETDPDTVRAPDASFVSRARVEAAGGIPESFWPGPPDVAFEVTSPRDRRGEVQSKTRSWLEAGASAVVVVDPRRRVATIHRPGGGEPQRLTGGGPVDLNDSLPGFAPTVDDLLA
ncbi:MAG: Uma2 family endonuclease [Solirubrobacteraceae bacterium]